MFSVLRRQILDRLVSEIKRVVYEQIKREHAQHENLTSRGKVCALAGKRHGVSPVNIIRFNLYLTALTK